MKVRLIADIEGHCSDAVGTCPPARKSLLHDVRLAYP